jgi:thiamine-monophosphate kinase
MAVPALAELAWTGGDDYEILCTASEREYPALVASAEGSMLLLTPIGRVTAEAGSVTYLGRGGAQSFAQNSFSHF